MGIQVQQLETDQFVFFRVDMIQFICNQEDRVKTVVKIKILVKIASDEMYISIFCYSILILHLRGKYCSIIYTPLHVFDNNNSLMKTGFVEV